MHVNTCIVYCARTRSFIGSAQKTSKMTSDAMGSFISESDIQIDGSDSIKITSNKTPDAESDIVLFIHLGWVLHHLHNKVYHQPWSSDLH